MDNAKVMCYTPPSVLQYTILGDSMAINAVVDGYPDIYGNYWLGGRAMDLSWWRSLIDERHFINANYGISGGTINAIIAQGNNGPYQRAVFFAGHNSLKSHALSVQDCIDQFHTWLDGVTATKKIVIGLPPIDHTNEYQLHYPITTADDGSKYLYTSGEPYTSGGHYYTNQTQAMHFVDWAPGSNWVTNQMIADYNTGIQALCNGTSIVYVDLSAWLVSGEGDPTYLYDGLHPNEAGFEYIIALIKAID